MSKGAFETLRAGVSRVEPVRDVGRIIALTQAGAQIAGLDRVAQLGDRVEIAGRDGRRHSGEILRLGAGLAEILPHSPLTGASVGDRAVLTGPVALAPDESWLGRIVDPFGQPLDGLPLLPGAHERPSLALPPPPASRRGLGGRLETGIAAFNTVLPIVRGQRVGLFAGSGVGKSTLLGCLARGLEADVVVIALVGERGREVRHFVDEVVGPEGMKRTVVVAATSDRSPLVRRRCGWAAMAVAEHFRDAGAHVLFLADSVTRFAEAHREIALAMGEPASLKGFPPSVSAEIMGLAERAGPGSGMAGDITAIFSVLVAGSDMEEPIADILRGVLDGHVVLDRAIAERGRYPAIDLVRSISRSLPAAASEAENGQIQDARALLTAYEQAELMIQAGLYVRGSDPRVDRAIACWPKLDAFLSVTRPETIQESFVRLQSCLESGAAA